VRRAFTLLSVIAIAPAVLFLLMPAFAQKDSEAAPVYGVAIPAGYPRLEGNLGRTERHQLCEVSTHY
jgi:hypothetical protein